MPASDPPLPYPAHWEADVLLSDGGSARVRPIRPADGPKLIEFYSRVSPQSKYMRFFAPYPMLSDKDVEHFTHVDNVERVGLVLTIRSQIVAVGRYDMLDESDGLGSAHEAEIAFLVEDAHQGRGIAQVLLEHLADAGRERGVTKFVAEVLPDNNRMIATFRAAGYKVGGGYKDGVLMLEFAITPTDTSVGVMRSREHRAEARSMERFFVAGSVAVIGASRRHDTIGASLVRHLVMGDYSGRIYVVNPAADSVAGMPAYHSVRDIPGKVDLAIIAVPAEAVQEVVLDCAGKGVHGLVVISSGFAEAGDEGRLRQRKLVGLARSYGLRLVGPNCLGVINTAPEVSLNASLAPDMPLRGPVGFFCQSGALGVAILETVARRGIGLSTFVSAGNRADVSGNDLLQYWEEDPATEVVLLYLESIGNPRKFSRIARRVGRAKPVVAVKSGRTTQGVPLGHAVKSTRAPQAAVDAMFRQAGVIQVETLDEMFDVAQLLAHQPLPMGPRVAIVGNSDALGLLAADSASAAGLTVRTSVALGADATAEEFEHALDEAIDSPDVDSVITVFIPPINTSGAEVAGVLATVGDQSDKPIVSTFLASVGVPELLRVPDLASDAGVGSVPSYPTPESAVRALARVVTYSQWANRPQGSVPVLERINRPAAHACVTRVLTGHRDGDPVELTAAEVGELLACYGVHVVPAEPVSTPDDAVAVAERLGWNVALKATSLRLRQRPDLAHIRRNISNEAEMRGAWAGLASAISSLSEAGLVVQPSVQAGIPITVGSLEDALFGPIVSFGLAGAPSELLGDTAYRIPPLTDLDAADLVREIRGAPLLFGYRGSDPVDVAAIEDLVHRVAQLKDDLADVEELTIGLAVAGRSGVDVLRATGRVSRVSIGRSETLARRLSGESASDDTLVTG